MCGQTCSWIFPLIFLLTFVFCCFLAAECELLARGECNSSRIAGRACVWVSDESRCAPADQIDRHVYEENMCPQSKMLFMVIID